MKLIAVFTILFIHYHQALAQVLLVPEKDVSLSTYLKQCQQEGYICTQDYFKSNIIQSSTPQFEGFLEKINLYNEDFRKQSLSEIKAILKSEHLDISQADLVIKIISKQISIDPNHALTEFKDELSSLVYELQNQSESVSDEESYVVLKKVLTKTQFLKLKYKTSFVKVTRVTPYTDPFFTNAGKENLLISGDCENPQFSTSLSQKQSLKFLPLFQEECKRTALFTQDNIDSRSLWSEYKKPILYTALGAAVILFLSQYQVQIQY